MKIERLISEYVSRELSEQREKKEASDLDNALADENTIVGLDLELGGANRESDRIDHVK